MPERLWSIVEIARLAGTSSRTLRHYDDIGLLQPTSIGANGYRYYDQSALVRLQRILLLRQLGIGLAQIAEIIEEQVDESAALATHLEWLRHEGERLERQITAVSQTLDSLKKGHPLMADEMFDGFDHTQYKEEVEEKWGADAYRRSSEWWSSMTDAQQRDFQQAQRQIAADFGAAHAAGEPFDGEAAQAISARHVAWLTQSSAATGIPITADYVVGLGDMYVADDRFGRNYDAHGAGTAAYVRDALRAYAELTLR